MKEVKLPTLEHYILVWLMFSEVFKLRGGEILDLEVLLLSALHDCAHSIIILLISFKRNIKHQFFELSSSGFQGSQHWIDPV